MIFFFEACTTACVSVRKIIKYLLDCWVVLVQINCKRSSVKLVKGKVQRFKR